MYKKVDRGKNEKKNLNSNGFLILEQLFFLFFCSGFSAKKKLNNGHFIKCEK